MAEGYAWPALAVGCRLSLPGVSSWVQALPARQRRQEFSGESRKIEEIGDLNYGPQFRVLFGGSKWLSALQTGSR